LIRRFYAKALSIMVLHVITLLRAAQGQKGQKKGPNTRPAPKARARNLTLRNKCRAFLA